MHSRLLLPLPHGIDRVRTRLAGRHCSGSVCTRRENPKLDRTTLPPATPAFQGKIGSNYKESTPDWAPAMPLTAPDGAPNVLLVVLDDVGYGHLGCYGGPIATPNLDKLAAGRPAVQQLPHDGALLPVARRAADGPEPPRHRPGGDHGGGHGISGELRLDPQDAATVAEVLKQNGYNTTAIGKWHLAPYTAYTSAGPFDRWPLGMGFEKFYGFLGGETDQWAPLLVQDNHFIDTPTRPGYHLTEDLVDQALA